MLRRNGLVCHDREMAIDIWSPEIAERYDAQLREMADPALIEATTEFLVDFARDGGALEFAIGTGRIGLPLSERGVAVTGIELSPAMAAQLAAKPGAGAIAVTIGDMATASVDGDFGLVYLVYNTITNLLTQAEQVDCFRNAAAHLRSGGRFVVETMVPQIGRLGPGEKYHVFDASDGHIGLSEFDLVNQTSISHHVWIDGKNVQVFASTHRYAWPAEYDLMAQLAGLELDQRWANWQRDPLTSQSAAHVSVWRKP